VKRAITILPLLALVACAHAPPPPLVITGDTLHAAKLSVVATEAGMREADEHGLLTREQKLTWNAFLAKFKPGYRVAVEMWEAADASADKSKQEQAAAIVGALLVGLTQFTVMLAEAHANDGGVP
jgi:hypothetical protein